jgi:hypothetical protein
MTTKNYDTLDEAVYLDGTIYWASLYQKNKVSDRYELELVPDNPEEVKEMGVALKTKDFGNGPEQYVKIASSLNAQYPIRVVFDDTEVEAGTLVGNGSSVRVKCELAKTTFNRKDFIKLARPKTVRVKELVRYESAERDERMYA